MFSVGFLSRFLEHLTSKHMVALKRVLSYINGTLDDVLICENGQVTEQLASFTNSDYDRDVEDQKSTMGHIFFYGSVAIIWIS